jgi:hypothetical protein
LRDDDRIRDDIARDPSQAADHHALADARELLDGAQTTHEYVIADLAESAERRVVGKHHMIADDAVVRDMRSGHHERVVADRGRAAPFRRPEADRDMLADVTVFADRERRVLAVIVHRLRRRAERGERPDRGACADRGAALNGNVAHQLATVADRDLRADHAVRADLDAGADDRGRSYSCGRVDRQHRA